MKKDLPENIVKDVAIAIVLEQEYADGNDYRVYLINLSDKAINNVLISSKGYGQLDGEGVRTSTLRHFFEQVGPGTFVGVETIQDRLFGLNNEYWLSYYQDKNIFDRKFIFLPESVVEGNFIRIPLVNKPGVMIR